MRLDLDFTGFPDETIPLNPMQELVVPYIAELEDRNLIVSAPTASGKSTVPKMLGKYVLDDGLNVIYIGIMKALAEEKAEDWAKDNWKDYPQATVTSDFRDEDGYEEKLEKARIVCITPESLASRLRKVGDHPQWLSRAGLLVIDEIHLLADGQRGANLEAAIMEFCHKFPECRVVGLSATVPNVNEIADWLTAITGTQTDVVRSDFRPVPIVENFMPHKTLGLQYTEVETTRNEMILNLVNDSNKFQQQFLVAVFNKSYGRRLLEFLKSAGVSADFHSADSDKSKRKRIENDFKNGSIRVLLTTSTLFTGVNLPARNVIITAVCAGNEDVPVYTLKQAAGRAGRPKYDLEGDVFYIVPKHDLDRHETRILRGESIMSQLRKREFLSMHVVGAIHLGRITNSNDFDFWYGHTLAYQQGVRTTEQIEKIRTAVIDALKKAGVVFVKEGNGIEYYSLSRIGIISAQMYLDPYHYVSALNAIKRYSLLDNPSEFDYIKAMSLWFGYTTNSLSYEEKMALPQSMPAVPDQFKKATAVITYRVKGEKIPSSLLSMNALIYNDLSRMHTAVVRAVNETKSIQISQDRVDLMFTRIYAQCSWEQAQMSLNKFTKKERQKLQSAGIMTFQQAKNNLVVARNILGNARADELGIAVGTGRKDSSGVMRFGKK